MRPTVYFNFLLTINIVSAQFDIFNLTGNVQNFLAGTQNNVGSLLQETQSNIQNLITGTQSNVGSLFAGSSSTQLACNRRSQAQRLILQSNSQQLPLNCNYTIQPFKRNICQIRIDFEIFQLPQPTYDPNTQSLVCNSYFTIVTRHSQQQQQTSEHLRLCGENGGQHFYTPLHNNEELHLAFMLSERWPQTSWRLVVTQIECMSIMPAKRSSRTAQLLLRPIMNLVQGTAANIQQLTRPALQQLTGIASNNQQYAAAPINQDIATNSIAQQLGISSPYQRLFAPSGCQQYYTQAQGVISSFNFNPQQRSLYMPNLDYSICIANPNAVTHIKYRVQYFEMSQQNSNAMGFDDECHAVVETVARKMDYLMISQARIGQFSPTYFCGDALKANTEIIASAPFHLQFHSDNRSDEMEIGFRISYQLCGNSECN